MRLLRLPLLTFGRPIPGGRVRFQLMNVSCRIQQDRLLKTEPFTTGSVDAGTAHTPIHPRLAAIRHNSAVATMAATVAKTICLLQRVVCSPLNS